MPNFQSPSFVEPTRVELSVMAVEAGACTIYGWHNLTIVVWCGQASAASVLKLDQVSALCRKRDPHGHSAVHIVHEPTLLPSVEARAALVRMMNENAGFLAAIAIVVQGHGFWATAMRSVVTAMRIVGSRAFELRINGTIHEVAEWIPAVHFKRTGINIGSDALLHALQQAERQTPGLAIS
jgi:hypothetical protein